MVGTRICVAILFTLSAGEPLAQQAPRFEVGPLVRVDRVRVEGGLVGSMPTMGVGISVRVLKSLSVEAEVTRAEGPFERHYSGWFRSWAPPGSSREDIERLAPTARRDLRYVPGWGGGGAFVLRSALSNRVDLGIKLGLAGRTYVETSTFTILTIPEALDEAQVRAAFIDERRDTSRGGVWLGGDAPICLTPRLRVIPEARFILGPRQVGNAHREWSVGVRGVWGL
jgi:hypothetical protein